MTAEQLDEMAKRADKEYVATVAADYHALINALCEEQQKSADFARQLDESREMAGAFKQERDAAYITALKYIDGWIDYSLAMPMIPAGTAVLRDIRVHVLAAISRLERGERLEATSELMST